MEIAAFVVSIISIVVSVGTIFYDKMVDKKINEINMNSIYFNELFMEILSKKLPQCRRRIIFDNSGQLTGTDELIDVLREFRVNSQFFRYTDPIFFKSLINALQKLEDDVLTFENEKHIGKEQTKINRKISEDVSKIYKLTFNKLSHGFLKK